MPSILHRLQNYYLGVEKPNTTVGFPRSGWGLNAWFHVDMLGGINRRVPSKAPHCMEKAPPSAAWRSGRERTPMIG